MRDPAPFETLTSLVEEHASGEFISASKAAEVHVYLQRGRVAWATDSEHPFAFTRYLQTSTAIDTEGFRDILESCKRERRPLGETLVAWGLVSSDEIRAALHHQLGLALASLRDGGPAHTVFLDRTRQFARYDEGLTFSIDEFSTEPVQERAPTRNSRTPQSLRDVAAASAQRLFDTGDDVLWAELFGGGDRVESVPQATEGPRFATEIMERTLLDGSELAILWLPEGLLAGIALPDARSLWCRLASDSTVGAAASALGVFVPSARSGEFAPYRAESSPWVLCLDEDPALEEMLALLKRAPEMLAAFVVDANEPRRTCGVGRPALALDLAMSTIEKRSHVLAIDPVFQDGIAKNPDAAGVGFHFRSMVTAEPRVWCFGAELVAPLRRTAWVLLDRRASQGLGWAYLTSLSRRLLHAAAGGRRG